MFRESWLLMLCSTWNDQVLLGFWLTLSSPFESYISTVLLLYISTSYCTFLNFIYNKMASIVESLIYMLSPFWMTELMMRHCNNLSYKLLVWRSLNYFVCKRRAFREWGIHMLQESDTQRSWACKSPCILMISDTTTWAIPTGAVPTIVQLVLTQTLSFLPRKATLPTTPPTV